MTSSIPRQTLSVPWFTLAADRDALKAATVPLKQALARLELLEFVHTMTALLDALPEVEALRLTVLDKRSGLELEIAYGVREATGPRRWRKLDGVCFGTRALVEKREADAIAKLHHELTGWVDHNGSYEMRTFLHRAVGARRAVNRPDLEPFCRELVGEDVHALQEAYRTSQQLDGTLPPTPSGRRLRM